MVIKGSADCRRQSIHRNTKRSIKRILYKVKGRPTAVGSQFIEILREVYRESSIKVRVGRLL